MRQLTHEIFLSTNLKTPVSVKKGGSHEQNKPPLNSPLEIPVFDKVYSKHTQIYYYHDNIH